MEAEELIAVIKALRVSIDACVKQAEAIADELDFDGGREIAFSIAKLQEAKMWAGQALGELGQKLPEAYRDEAE